MGNFVNFLYGVKRVKRFVGVHLHCIVSNLKRISKMMTLPLPGKISADAHGSLDSRPKLRDRDFIKKSETEISDLKICGACWKISKNIQNHVTTNSKLNFFEVLADFLPAFVVCYVQIQKRRNTLNYSFPTPYRCSIGSRDVEAAISSTATTSTLKQSR